MPVDDPPFALRALGADEFAIQELEPLAPILAPVIWEKTLIMIHAKRGVGKTYFALALSFAIANGTQLFNWRAPWPQSVLYVDGEMQAQRMQERLKAMGLTMGGIPSRLLLVSPDLQDGPMPDLGTIAGQRQIDALVTEDTALIVIDNLSCLLRSGGAENDAESWGFFSSWLLAHRRAGRAVLIIHHSGKGGAQRGTSKREDILDVVINLRRPVDYSEADGAVFEIVFEKARSMAGEAVDAIQAQLTTLPDGGQAWAWSALSAVQQKNIVDIWNAGAVTLIDVAREMELNKSSAHRKLLAAMEAGQLTRPYPTPKKGAA